MFPGSDFLAKCVACRVRVVVHSRPFELENRTQARRFETLNVGVFLSNRCGKLLSFAGERHVEAHPVDTGFVVGHCVVRQVW